MILDTWILNNDITSVQTFIEEQGLELQEYGLRDDFSFSCMRIMCNCLSISWNCYAGKSHYTKHIAVHNWLNGIES